MSTIRISAAETVVLGATDEFGVHWKINPDGFDGWGTPVSTIQVEQNQRRPGGWAGEAYDSARYMAVRGLITAPTPELLTSSLDRLSSAVALDGVTFEVTEAGLVRHCLVRRQDAVASKRITNRIAQYAFQVVALDPRKLGDEMTGSTLLSSTSGGLSAPFTAPFTAPAVTVSGQVSLTNPGNVAGPVVLRVDGPCPGPVIAHTAAGISEVFASSLALEMGEWLDIDMESHEVLANGQASRAKWITSRGWGAFEPGVNTWFFTAAQFDPASRLTVFATQSWE